MANNNTSGTDSFDLYAWDNHEGERIDIQVDYSGYIEAHASDMDIVAVICLSTGEEIDFKELPKEAQDDIVEMAYAHLEGDN